MLAFAVAFAGHGMSEGIGPPTDWEPDHPHPLDCRCAKCECDRNPPFGIGPPFDSGSDSMNVWCEGCGEDAPLDPVEVDGRGVLMLCDRCYREYSEDDDG